MLSPPCVSGGRLSLPFGRSSGLYVWRVILRDYATPSLAARAIAIHASDTLETPGQRYVTAERNHMPALSAARWRVSAAQAAKAHIGRPGIPFYWPP
eukprot:6175935-Pleurochrysis_carterae.AAC.3